MLVHVLVQAVMVLTPSFCLCCKSADGPLSDLNESLAIGYFQEMRAKELAKKFENKRYHLYWWTFFEEYVTKTTCNEDSCDLESFYFE